MKFEKTSAPNRTINHRGRATGVDQHALSTFNVSVRRAIANRKAPAAPMPAASVGVNTPIDAADHQDEQREPTPGERRDRSGQARSAGGPAAGSRRAIDHRDEEDHDAEQPGTMPAMYSLPMSVSVMCRRSP